MAYFFSCSISAFTKLLDSELKEDSALLNARKVSSSFTRGNGWNTEEAVMVRPVLPLPPSQIVAKLLPTEKGCFLPFTSRLCPIFPLLTDKAWFTPYHLFPKPVVQLLRVASLSKVLGEKGERLGAFSARNCGVCLCDWEGLVR